MVDSQLRESVRDSLDFDYSASCRGGGNDRG